MSCGGGNSDTSCGGRMVVEFRIGGMAVKVLVVEIVLGSGGGGAEGY